jgi:hypothetical protein
VPRYYFHLSTPDARCLDPVGCEVSDLSVTRPHVRARAAQRAGSRMSLSRVINRASLTATPAVLPCPVPQSHHQSKPI